MKRLFLIRHGATTQTGEFLYGGAAVFTAILLGLHCKRRIGGMTGDTLEATHELVEAMVPLAICAWGAHP